MSTLQDVLSVIEYIAPAKLAEPWDNCGLTVGDPSWKVLSVGVALDPLPDTLALAQKEGVDCLVTHHPLWIKPPKQLNLSVGPGKIVHDCVMSNMGLIAAHTNWDSAAGGLNDYLSDLLKLTDASVLARPVTEPWTHIVFGCPDEDASSRLEQVLSTEHGKGNFLGQFHKNGRDVMLDIATAQVANIISIPQQTGLSVTTSSWPLSDRVIGQGLGRIGHLDSGVSLNDFVSEVKQAFGLDHVRVVGDLSVTVQAVAICSGSGGSLIEDVIRSGCDVYISGDIKYHEVRDLEAAGIAHIDAGHFGSEVIGARHLASAMQSAASELEIDIKVVFLDGEKDPFLFM